MKCLNNAFLTKIIAICSLAVFLFVFLFLAGCGEVLVKKEAEQISSQKEAEQISVEKVSEILKTQRESYIILDVRTKEEFAGGHLDYAVLIPVDDLETRFNELEKDKPVIVYCKSGRRSAKAAAILISKGFSQVYDMTGGIDAWTPKGYPVIVENTGTDSAESSKSSETSNGNESMQESENTASYDDTSDSAGLNQITADELKAKITNQENIIILDVRSEDSYLIKHIAGAINIPYRDFEGRMGELDKSKEIIAYCSNYDCGLSANAVTMLVKSGFKNVSALEGGIESWEQKGYPVE